MQDELIEAAMQGDEPACRDLFDRWYPKAYRIGKAVCRNRASAEDAVQEALIRFWRVLPRLRKPEAAQGYFLRIVANEAKRIRSGTKARPEESAADIGHRAEGVADDEGHSQRMELAKAVCRLPEKLGLAVKLHYYGGFTESETANLLGISLSSLKMRLLRSRRRLKELLEREGFTINGG